MSKTLIIVESPTKAAKIKSLLGANYDVMASLGHICDLAKGGKDGIGINIDDDFKPRYVLMKEKVELLQLMMDTAEKSDEIVIFSDPDREGMAIAYHVKRYLSHLGIPIKVGLLHEITERGIGNAFKSLSDINMNLFRSQEARRILDRIVGFMVSPYLINNYGPNLSAGRVQSVAVRMITDRESEIDIFKPEEFWNIAAKFRTQNNEPFIAKFAIKPKNKAESDVMIETLKKQEFYVSAVSSQKKKEKPCPPMTTATLQQYMARKFSFEPDHTMKIAQTLYENGYCTYIRTDSTRTSEDAIPPVREWLVENKFHVPKNPNEYEAKSSAQDAHECIRPTNVKNTPDNSIFSGDEKNVYTAIWQHFVASQMNPAVWDTMSVSIRSRTTPKLSFTVSGKALNYKGYLEIFGPIDPGKIEIPNLNENDAVALDDIKSEQKFTQHPPRFNNDTILKELEKRQIGRPATYAEIIKKISSRNYVEKTGSTYKPTDLGKKITKILVDLFPFMEYTYTAELEKQLDDIAAGNVDSIKMLREFFIPFKSKLDQAYIDNGGVICDKCGSPMIVRTNSKDQTKFIACSSYPKCYNTKTHEIKTN